MVDFILISDLHISDKTPVCRTDEDYRKTVIGKLKFIDNLAKKHGCPILCAGDLLDHWKPSPELLSFCLEYLPDNMYTIVGNHELPQNSMELFKKSGMYTLIKAGKIKLLKGAHWGEKIQTSIEHTTKNGTRRTIAVIHEMVYKVKDKTVGENATNGRRLLRKHPQFDLIVSGHNHATFTIEINGKLLVNVGSMLRTSASQIDKKPCIFLYDGETNSVERVNIPIKQTVTREHLEIKEEKEGRILAFISKLDQDFDAEICFLRNMELYLSSNNVDEATAQIVYSSVK